MTEPKTRLDDTERLIVSAAVNIMRERGEAISAAYDHLATREGFAGAAAASAADTMRLALIELQEAGLVDDPTPGFSVKA